MFRISNKTNGHHIISRREGELPNLAVLRSSHTEWFQPSKNDQQNKSQ